MRVTFAGTIKSTLLATTALFALVAIPAAAQTSADDGSFDNREIVVTAQKRVELLQDVPISITAVTGDMVEKSGVVNLTDIGQLSVGVNITNNGPQIQPTIRGITSLTGSAGQDNNVAIYIDGVYQASPTNLNQELLDIKSIQILKGPQGTLFGRNSTAGAILIETLSPEFETRGRVRASYGRFNDYSFQGFVTGPIVKDVLAISLSGAHRRSDGYLKDLFARFDPAPLKNDSIRGKLLFRPTDDLKFTLAGDYSVYHNPASVTYRIPTRNIVAFENPGVTFATQPGTVSLDAPNLHKSVSRTGSLTAEWNLGFATLKSISAYNRSNTDTQQDGDGTPVTRSFLISNQETKTFTQEVNLGGTSGRLDWVLGGFYYKQDGSSTTIISGAAPAVNKLGAIPTIPRIFFGNPRAWAAFADGTYRLTDHLAIIAGVRYSWEKKVIVLPPPLSTTDPAAATAATPYLANNQASKTWHDITPRVSLRYEIADNTNIYASFTKGFKSGSYGSSLPTVAVTPTPPAGQARFIAVSNPVDPEKVTAYEIGFKTAQRNWRLNVAGFYYDYKNLQVQTSSILPPPSPPILVTQLTNAASSKIYGLEINGSVDVTERLIVSAAVGWTHARYKNFTGAQVFGLCPVTQQTINGVSGFYDATGFVQFTSAAGICTDTTVVTQPAIPNGYNTRATGTMDRSGDPLLRAPDWTANLNLDYTVPTSYGDVGLNVAGSYSSKYGLNDQTPVGVANRGYRYAQPEYVMINAQLSLVPKFNENLKFTLWGRNLADEVIVISGIGSGGDRYIVGPPRTYGFQMDYRF